MYGVEHFVRQSTFTASGSREQGAGCGARHSLQGAGKQGGGLLHTEPEEGGIVGRRELEANASIGHRYGTRVQGETGGSSYCPIVWRESQKSPVALNTPSATSPNMNIRTQITIAASIARTTGSA